MSSSYMRQNRDILEQRARQGVPTEPCGAAAGEYAANDQPLPGKVSGKKPAEPAAKGFARKADSAKA